MVKRSFVLALALLTSATAAAAAASGSAGDLGDVRRIVIEGTSTFSAEQILAAVNGDIELQIASAPSAPLDAYLAALERQVRAGYREGGFRDARVVATHDPAEGGRVLLAVTEGPRYRRASIRVEGTPGAIPVDALGKRLTGPPSRPFFETTLERGTGHVRMTTGEATGDGDKSYSPTWEAGTPAGFEARSLAALDRKVRRALGELGFLHAEFEVRVEPDAKGAGGAALVIDVSDPGPAATLDRVEVHGAKLHDAKDIGAYLGLVEGQPFNLLTLEAAQRKLWDSGRFSRHVLTTRAAGRGAGRSRFVLRFDLWELPRAPPLREPLPELQQAMLRCRDHLEEMVGRNEDLAVEVSSADLPGQSIEIAFGFDRGAAARAGSAVGFAVEPGRLTFHNLAERERLTLPGAERYPVELRLNYVADEKPVDDRLWVLNVNGGVSARRQRARPPIDFRMRLAPAAFVALAHDETFKIELKDGELRAAAPAVNLRADAATGRLIELGWRHGEWTGVVRAERGVLASTARHLDEETDETFKAGAPVGSWTRFMFGGFASFYTISWDLFGHGLNQEGVARLQSAFAAARPLLSADVTEPLEVLSGGHAGDEEELFQIPSDYQTPGPAAIWRVAAHLALPFTAELFPRGSWPWTVVRESVQVVAGKPSEASAEVLRIFEADETGPLGYLACAELLARSGAAESAASFARRGLGRLSAEDFARDWAALVGQSGRVPQCLSRLIRRLGELPAEDVDAIAAMLTPQHEAVFRRLAELAQKAPKGDAAESEAMRHIGKALWDESLGEAVESRLRELAGSGGGPNEKTRTPFGL